MGHSMQHGSKEFWKLHTKRISPALLEIIPSPWFSLFLFFHRSKLKFQFSGFRIDPAERLDAIYKEISSLHKTYR